MITVQVVPAYEAIEIKVGLDYVRFFGWFIRADVIDFDPIRAYHFDCEQLRDRYLADLTKELRKEWPELTDNEALIIAALNLVRAEGDSNEAERAEEALTDLVDAENDAIRFILEHFEIETESQILETPRCLKRRS